MQIVRIEEVMKIVRLSRTSIWRRVKDGDFPPPRRLGGQNTRAVGWTLKEIEDWLESRKPAGGEGRRHNCEGRARRAVPPHKVLSSNWRRPRPWAQWTKRKSRRPRVSITGDPRRSVSYRDISFRAGRKIVYR